MILNFFFFTFPKKWVGRAVGNETFYGDGLTRFFLAVAYEHCVTMKHFRFGDKIEMSLNLFFFIYFQGSEFSRSAFGCHENSDPRKQIKKKELSSSQSYCLKCFMVTQSS